APAEPPSVSASQPTEPILDVIPVAPVPVGAIAPHPAIAAPPPPIAPARPAPSVRKPGLPAWAWLRIGGMAGACLVVACGLGVYFFFGAAAPRNAPIPAVIRVTADDRFELYLNGTQVGAGDDWHRTYYFNVNLRPGSNLIAVKGENLLLEAGLLFD